MEPSHDGGNVPPVRPAIRGVVRPIGRAPLRVILVGNRFLAIRCHWEPEEGTYPCVPYGCVRCEAQRPSKIEGFIPAITVVGRREVTVGLTMHTMCDLLELEGKHRALRGLDITFQRFSNAKNGRVTASRAIRTDPSALPAEWPVTRDIRHVMGYPSPALLFIVPDILADDEISPTEGQ